jgi:protein TonB
VLNYAIAGSLVLHAGLLFLVSLEKQGRRESSAPGPIVARLVAPAAAPAAPTPAQPEPPKPRVEEAPKPPPPVVKPAPVQKPSPIPVPVQRETKAAPPPTPSAPPQPAAPAPQAAPAPATTPAPAPGGPVARVDPKPAPPAAPSADLGALEDYRVDILRMAKNYKRYPRVAMDNNWEGRAVVRMTIGANGMISSLTVLTSAGHEVLDKQALDMIQKAKPRVQIPAALRGREFTIEIPVIYSLKDNDAG